GGLLPDDGKPRDYHLVAGRFPLFLHNGLLINDDMLGFVVNKNQIPLSPLSNLNVQVFGGIDSFDVFQGSWANMFGVHAAADYHHAFFETTAATLNTSGGANANFAAVSGTHFFGMCSVAGRGLFKWADTAGRGDAQLYVLESNRTRRFSDACANLTGIDHGVFYANLFRASRGWTPISGGNFNRLNSTFEVNPLVSISRVGTAEDTLGSALGVQLFRHHDDESWIPEVAYQAPGGTPTWGVSLSWLRKTGARTYIRVRGNRTWSHDASLEQEGVFASTFVVF
ncbi:MAG TPA: hypothetical protein VK137_02295, partial [Planctomycetaceae bacterium]|nr:hypothetical protein [Planctomycetaceae bacterium]